MKWATVVTIDPSAAAVMARTLHNGVRLRPSTVNTQQH
jgi:hypothetical protein